MISGPEITVIAVIALLLFGPDKIPQVMQTVKKAVGLYTEARDQVTDVVTTHVISQEDLDTLKDPLGLGNLVGDNTNNAKGTAGSPKNLLSPQRKALYTQNAATPAKLSETDAKAALAATSPQAFGAEATTTPQAETQGEQPAAPATTSNGATTPAESIWASLQPQQQQQPPQQSQGEASHD